MTAEQFRYKMECLSKMDDVEVCHERMDELMCELLRDIGYKDGVDIFENTSKWYA